MPPSRASTPSSIAQPTALSSSIVAATCATSIRLRSASSIAPARSSSASRSVSPYSLAKRRRSTWFSGRARRSSWRCARARRPGTESPHRLFRCVTSPIGGTPKSARIDSSSHRLHTHRRSAPVNAGGSSRTPVRRSTLPWTPVQRSRDWHASSCRAPPNGASSMHRMRAAAFGA